MLLNINAKENRTANQEWTIQRQRQTLVE